MLNSETQSRPSYSHEHQPDHTSFAAGGDYELITNRTWDDDRDSPAVAEADSSNVNVSDDNLTPCCSDADVAREHAKGLTDKTSLRAQSFLPEAGEYLKQDRQALLFATLYAILAIFPWTVTCYLSFRPIGVNSYSYNFDNTKEFAGMDGADMQRAFAKSDNYLYAAKVTNSILAVLTIPLASAVCAKAAVVYMQESRRRLTLRQLILLADKGWVSLETITTLLRAKQWRNYSSTLLWLAVLLHLIGAVLAPLQQALVGQKTIKTPREGQNIDGLTDIPAFFVSSTSETGNMQDGLVTSLRYALAATKGNEVQPYLWLGNATTCNYKTEYQQNACTSTGGRSYASMAAMQDPFIAQLPANFDTGLLRQFVPRLNSSLTYEDVDLGEFPSACDQLPGAFYVNYTMDGMYHVEICMPANQTNSPWRPVRDHQDITEIAYLYLFNSYEAEYKNNRTVFKVQAHSTAGYFELPNYLNRGPGPLLEKDPFQNGICEHCWPQSVPVSSSFAEDPTPLDTFGTTGTKALDFARNRGPLLMVMEALFGATSLMAARFASPSAYVLPDNSTSGDDSIPPICYDLPPLVGIIKDISTSTVEVNDCVRLQRSVEDVHSDTGTWLSLFWNDTDTPTIPTLTAALYIANQIWLQQGALASSDLYPALNVLYDPGADTVVPTVSIAAMVVISVLLVSFIAMLFAMAAYASRMPLWTPSLNAFAIIRIGAAVGDQMRLHVASNPDKVAILDELPGWIGDEAPDADTGRLGLGSMPVIRKGRRYEAL